MCPLRSATHLADSLPGCALSFLAAQSSIEFRNCSTFLKQFVQFRISETSCWRTAKTAKTYLRPAPQRGFGSFGSAPSNLRGDFATGMFQPVHESLPAQTAGLISYRTVGRPPAGVLSTSLRRS